MGGDMSKGPYRRIGEMFDKNKDYKKARVKDADVKNFHHTLAEEMGGVIKTLENARAEDGLPVTFFEVLISCLAKLDGHLKDLRLKNEEDIQENPKLKALIDLYIKLHEKTKKFYNRVSNWAVRVIDNQALLEVALQFIEPPNPSPGKEQYMKCMKKLSEYKAAQNLFDEELMDLLDSIDAQHKEIQDKLEAERKKSGGKLKWVSAWRKFSNIFFAAAFVTVLICSMVAAVMTAPPLGAAIGAALPIGTVGEWLNYRLKQYEKKIKVEYEVIDTMQKRTHGGLCELKQIGACADRLNSTIHSILRSVDFYCKDEDHQKVAAEHIREKLPTVKDQIRNLKGPLEYIREKRQSVEDTVEELKTQNKSIKQKLKHLTTSVNHLQDRIQDNCNQVVTRDIRCGASTVLRQR